MQYILDSFQIGPAFAVGLTFSSFLALISIIFTSCYLLAVLFGTCREYLRMLPSSSSLWNL